MTRENMPDNEADFKGEKVTVGTAKATLGDLIAQAVYGQKRFILTRHGKPAAALVSLDDLRKLEEVA